MARIAGIDLPPKKRIVAALRYLHGIGWTAAGDILDKAGVPPDVRSDQLSDQQAAKIREVIERDYKVEGDLRKEVSMNVKRLTDLGAYRGLRHRARLPVHGQRTHTNARTRKGKPRVAVAGKKKSLAPT